MVDEVKEEIATPRAAEPERAEQPAAASEAVVAEADPVLIDVTPNVNAAADVKSECSGSLSDLERKIIRQVEYYFGDVNIKRDKFLEEQRKLDDGWVTLETMIKFNRLRQMTEDQGVIATALRKSASGLLEVSEDDKKVRRVLADPEDMEAKDRDVLCRNRSLYVKGFPQSATLDEILEFVERYGKTEAVFMRRYNKTQFKGSCFVLFASDEAAKKFLDAQDVQYNDAPLIRLLKSDYQVKKIEERKHKGGGDKAKPADSKEKEGDAKRVQRPLTKGAILELTGVPLGTNREELKAHFLQHGAVEWIDFEKGQDKARLRFKGEDEAKVALDKAKVGDKVTFKDVELTCVVLEGDEEQKHWDDIGKHKQQRWGGGGRGGDRGGRGGGRGGRGGGRGSRGNDRRRGGRGGGGRGGKRNNDDGDQPGAKKLKTEDSDNEGGDSE